MRRAREPPAPLPEGGWTMLNNQYRTPAMGTDARPPDAEKTKAAGLAPDAAFRYDDRHANDSALPDHAQDGRGPASRIAGLERLRYALVPVDPTPEGYVDVVLTVRIDREQRRRDLTARGYCTCHLAAPCPTCAAWAATIDAVAARTSLSWMAAK